MYWPGISPCSEDTIQETCIVLCCLCIAIVLDDLNPLVTDQTVPKNRKETLRQAG
jgi:hypothetical protein